MEVTSKKNPVAQISTETENLRHVALEILKEAIEVREFFVGIDTPSESEADKPVGEASSWLDAHVRDLRDIEKVLTSIGLNVRRFSALLSK